MSDEKKTAATWTGETAGDVNDLKFSNKPDVHARRYKVMRLRFVQKWSVPNIASALGQNERTIYRDIEAILKVNGEARRRGQVFKKDTNTVLLELEAAHMERQQQRWQEYYDTKDKGLRRRLLNDIADDEEKHMKMLQSIGIVDKAAENVNVNQTTETWPEKMARLRRERQEAAASVAASKEGELT